MKTIIYSDRCLWRLICRDTGLDIYDATGREKVKSIAVIVHRIANVFADHSEDFGLSESKNEPFCYPATVALPDGSFASVRIFFLIDKHSLTVVRLEMHDHDPDRIDAD